MRTTITVLALVAGLAQAATAAGTAPHSGGANVALGDASVRWVRYGLQPGTAIVTLEAHGAGYRGTIEQGGRIVHRNRGAQPAGSRGSLRACEGMAAPVRWARVQSCRRKDRRFRRQGGRKVMERLRAAANGGGWAVRRAEGGGGAGTSRRQRLPGRRQG